MRKLERSVCLSGDSSRFYDVLFRSPSQGFFRHGWLFPSTPAIASCVRWFILTLSVWSGDGVAQHENGIGWPTCKKQHQCQYLPVWAPIWVITCSLLRKMTCLSIVCVLAFAGWFLHINCINVVYVSKNMFYYIGMYLCIWVYRHLCVSLGQSFYFDGPAGIVPQHSLLAHQVCRKNPDYKAIFPYFSFCSRF